MPTLKTLGGWAIVVSLGGLYYYFTKQRLAEKNRRKVALKVPIKSISTQKEAKARKPRKDGGLSGGEGQMKRSLFTSEITPSYSSGTASYDPEEDNREFARQLSKTKSGTVMASNSEKASRQKSVKQSRAKEKTAPETSSDNATAPSSATGGDADDDQSSTNSPDLIATKMASPVTNGGISDMLESEPSRAAILRVTEPTNPTQPKKVNQASFESVETKKQRQNRQKAEAKKLARAEEEKERKIMEENQRRTARIAEGRAAKDGSTFMAVAAPSRSAWSASAPVAGGESSGNSKVDLLDTYERSSINPAAAASSGSQYSENELASSDWQKLAQTLPSEEEQMKLAMEDSDNWKTVTNKERRTAKKTPMATKDDKQSSTDTQDGYGVPRAITPTGPGKKWGMSLVHVEPNGEVVEREKEVQDSEWEVS